MVGQLKFHGKGITCVAERISQLEATYTLSSVLLCFHGNCFRLLITTFFSKECFFYLIFDSDRSFFSLLVIVTCFFSTWHVVHLPIFNIRWRNQHLFKFYIFHFLSLIILGFVFTLWLLKHLDFSELPFGQVGTKVSTHPQR